MTGAPRYLQLYGRLTATEKQRYHMLVRAYEPHVGTLNDRQREYLAENVRAGKHPRLDRLAELGSEPRPAA